MDEEKYFTLSERDLKNYYEKFCFLNHHIELSLSDPSGLSIIEQYGFTLVDDND